MGSCLNVLNDPTVFVSTAALLVIVLLVWAQLHSRGHNDYVNVNFYCGLAWTFSSILFALIAIAALVLGFHGWDKGFLILSFLMTGVIICIAILQNVVRIFRPDYKSLVGEGAISDLWSFWWLFLWIGLGLISFSLVGVLCGYCLWIGIVLSGVVAICGMVIVLWPYRRRLRRLWTCIKEIRWFLVKRGK